MNIVVEGIDILNQKQAVYGRQILPTLSAKLVPQFRKRLVNDFSLVPTFLIFFIVPFFFFLLLKVEKISQKGYNHNMPKLYEYFGLIVLFYSNDHRPIHVHGKYQEKESKAELVIIDGVVKDIEILPVRGKAPLEGKELRKFKQLVEYFKEDIVKKWIDFFVLNKEVKTETINKKLG